MRIGEPFLADGRSRSPMDQKLFLTDSSVSSCSDLARIPATRPILKITPICDLPLTDGAQPVTGLSHRSQDCYEQPPPVRINWHSVRLRHAERCIRKQFRITGTALAAILLLALIGGLFHHHESESDCATCSYCHASVQPAVIDLVNTLFAPSLQFMGVVFRTRAACLPRTVQFSTLVPRAPPVTTQPSCFGRVALHSRKESSAISPQPATKLTRI